MHSSLSRPLPRAASGHIQHTGVHSGSEINNALLVWHLGASASMANLTVEVSRHYVPADSGNGV
jgi:hypothetical protein